MNKSEVRRKMEGEKKEMFNGQIEKIELIDVQFYERAHVFVTSLFMRMCMGVYIKPCMCRWVWVFKDWRQSAWIDGGETEGEELSIGFKLCR